MSPDLFIVSGSQGKLREWRSLLSGMFNIHSAFEKNPNLHWDESGLTFAQNALIKIEAFAHLTQNAAILGEDSGLCVEALDGAPGVYSKRFAGPDARDEDNNRKLLEALCQLPPSASRKAFFMCAVAFRPAGSEAVHIFQGRCDGEIIETPRGDEGFGYDPIFVPNNFQKTLAQLPIHTKNSISHRFKAFDALQRFLKSTQG